MKTHLICFINMIFNCMRLDFSSKNDIYFLKVLYSCCLTDVPTVAMFMCFRSSRSHSRSFSPAPKKRKHRTPSPSRKLKKDKYSPERRSKDTHKSRKRRHRSRSRSYSYSPQEAGGHRKRAKERGYEGKDRDYKENKDSRYYSPDRHSRKHHRNGHSSPTRLDKYDKYRR